MTIKFIDAHGENSNIDLGTVGVIGTFDLSAETARLGPVAATFGVVKGAAPLVRRDLDDEGVSLINSKKCLVIYSTAELEWVCELAAAIKDIMPTFQVNGADPLPSSLAN